MAETYKGYGLNLSPVVGPFGHGGLLGTELQTGDLDPLTGAVLGTAAPAPSLASLDSPTGPEINVSDLYASANASAPGAANGYAPSLIDLNALSARYNPDAGVMGQYDSNGNLINTETDVALGRAQGGRDQAVQQVGNITPMAADIYGRIGAQLDSAANSAAANASSVLGQGIAAPAADLTALQNASALSRAGFEQQSPLLTAGFDERLVNQQAQLGSMRTNLLNQNEQARQAYLADLGSQRTAALGQAEQYNASARSQAAAAAADAANRAAEARARAQQQTFENKMSLRQLEQTDRELATKPVSEGGKLTPQQQIDQSIDTYFPDPNLGTLVDPARGYALARSGFKPYGKGVNAYNDVKKWMGEGMTPEEIIEKLGKRAGSYSRAVSLALYEGTGNVGVMQSLSALGG